MKKIALLILCSACSMAPKYERQSVELPTKWRTSPTDGGDVANKHWWTKWDDPVLDSYIQEALDHNQDIMVAVYNVQTFMAELQVARSGFYPQLNVSGAGNKQQTSQTQQPFLPNITNSPQLSDIFSVPTRFDTFSLLLNGSYYLDFWGLVRSTADAALAELLSSIEARRTVVLSVVTAVASTYIDILQFDAEIRIVEETIATRTESLRIAQIRFELGITSQIEVEQAASELEEAEVRLYRLQISLAQMENLFLNLLGKTSGQIKRGKTLRELSMPFFVPTYLPSDLLNQRPDVLAVEQRLIAANANIGVARANFFPQMNLAAFIGGDTSQLKSLFNNASNIWQYGLTILQEVFTGGALTGNLKAAKAQKEMLLHQYQSTILTAVQEVNDALISHKIALEQEALQKEHVATLRQYFHLSKLQYDNGLTDYLTFLDAERQLLDGLLDYANAQGYSFTTLINIYKSLGGGWVIESDQSIPQQ